MVLYDLRTQVKPILKPKMTVAAALYPEIFIKIMLSVLRQDDDALIVLSLLLIPAGGN
jgi:hypothetical protein